MLSSSENLSTNKTIAGEERLANSQSALRRFTEVSSSSVCFNYINDIYLLITKVFRTVWFLSNTHPSSTSNTAVDDLSDRT